MSSFKIILILSFLASNSQHAQAQAVIGPTVGPVFGPVAVEFDASGLTLDNLKSKYNLKSKTSEESAIESKIYSLESLYGKQSCNNDTTANKALSMATGAARLDLMETSISMLDNPNRAKPILGSAQSESSSMTTASETLNTAKLTYNESAVNLRTKDYIKSCQTLNGPITNSSSSLDGSQNQLNYYACTMYQIMSNLSALFSDSDTLYQKATELETIVNKAMEEQTSRVAGIQTQENKIKEVNKELTSALAKLKKAKEDLKKSKEALTKANSSLSAANAIVCDTSASDSNSCESGKTAAIAAAAKEVDKATKDVEKATKDVENATKELLELLKTKMNFESRTVLALLSGTIYGDANGQDVHFKVNGNEFTMIDTDQALSSMLGLKLQEPHWGRYQLEHPEIKRNEGITVCGGDSVSAECQIDPGYADQISKYYVDTYFKSAADHLSSSKTDAPDKKYYTLLGGTTTREENNLMTARPADDDKSTAAILDKFYNMGSGGDNIETLGNALADYQAKSTAKQIATLEAMKTPDSRAKYNAAALDKTNELNRNIRAMIVNNICYLDSMLVLFHKTHDQTKNTLNEADKKKIDPLIEYLNNFSTARYKKKLEEGYKSSVKIDDILKEFDTALAKKLK